MPLLYSELRRLATAYLRRERRGHTLQPTALVHELYLRLVNQRQVEGQSRSQFLAITANLVRQILVNHALRRLAAKRSGGERVTLEDSAALISTRALDVIALDDALNKLAQFDPRMNRIVELRFFGGLTEEEIATVVGVSLTTVKRDWRVARAMLHHALGADSMSNPG
jgi:RNA polymerase sigma factor (TIGR02999 family)